MKKSLFLFALLAIMLSGCSAVRAIRYGMPSTDTWRNFALDTIHSGEKKSEVFITTPAHDNFLEVTKFSGGRLNDETVGEYFSRVRGDGALLIIRNDTVLLEKYYGYVTPDTPVSLFSISKALTSLLCGIAVDEGYIASVDDPVTKYIPELESRAAGFKNLTIAHLLDMRTGLDFKEGYGWNPFSQLARLYYGDDVLKHIKGVGFNGAPGESHYYNSMATAILGVLIERAVGKPYAEYMQEKVWGPLGMEQDAYVTLDDKKHRQAKAYGGIASNIRDLAKIGRLYLSGGEYNGQCIVSKDWIDRSTHSSLENNAYSFGWNNIISMREGKEYVTPRFFALGLFGQVLFCDPEKNLIFVTIGEKKGAEYHLLFDDLSGKL